MPWLAVGLTGVVLLPDGGEPERDGEVEVRDRLVQVEGDLAAVAGDGLVIQVLAGLLVGALVGRGPVLEGRDVEVRDRVGRALVDDVGREGPRDAVLDVVAGDRRTILPGRAITERESPLRGIGVVLARVSREVRDDGCPLLRVGRELVGRERPLNRSAEEGEVLTSVDALRVHLVPLLRMCEDVDRSAGLRGDRPAAAGRLVVRASPTTCRQRERDRHEEA